MSEMETKNGGPEDSWKYKRIITALAACGLTEKYEATFLEHEMDDEIVQSCLDNLREFDSYLSSIIPKIGHKFRFIAEFKKKKGNEGERTSSSQPAKNTPEQIQQPDSFINKCLDRVTMEVDDGLVEEEPEDVENNNDYGEPEIENSMNQMAKLKRSQDPPEKVNMEVGDASVPAQVEAEQKEAESNNERKPEGEISRKSNPMANPKELKRAAEKEEKKGKESEKQKDGPFLNKSLQKLSMYPFVRFSEDDRKIADKFLKLQAEAEKEEKKAKEKQKDGRLLKKKSDKRKKLKNREQEKSVFICDYCQKEFSCSSLLLQHVTVHTGQKDYHCNFCDYSASLKSNHEIHIRRHLNQRNFKCPEPNCGASFVSSSNLKVHESNHNKLKKFACSICPYKTHTKGHLTSHFKSIHSKSRPFKCPHENCEYSAKLKSTLKQHLEIHSLDKNQVCPHPNCGFKTKTSQALKKHMKTHSTGEKRHKCQFCDYCSHHQSNLVRHVRQHTGETPFACQLCSYKSKNQGNLNLHMKKHVE